MPIRTRILHSRCRRHEHTSVPSSSPGSSQTFLSPPGHALRPLSRHLYMPLMSQPADKSLLVFLWIYPFLIFRRSRIRHYVTSFMQQEVVKFTHEIGCILHYFFTFFNVYLCTIVVQNEYIHHVILEHIHTLSIYLLSSISIYPSIYQSSIFYHLSICLVCGSHLDPLRSLFPSLPSHLPTSSDPFPISTKTIYLSPIVSLSFFSLN